MLKIHLKSAASIDRHGCAFGYGRVYNTLKQYLSKRNDVELTEQSRADIQVCLTLPELKPKYYPWFAEDRHPVQVIYSMWETTLAPYGWDEVINSCAGFFTPSHFCKKVFIDSGVNVPIYVVQHGVDTNSFPELERDWYEDDIFILWQGMNYYDRKGFQWVRQALLELNNPHIWLIAKTYPMKSAEAPVMRDNHERIIYIRSFLSDDDYIDMMRRSLLSVSPSRGEGFGLMPLENAATGMLAAATGWSGFTDFLDENFFTIEYELCDIGKDYISTSPYVQGINYRPSQDAIPYVESIKNIIRTVYNEREAAKAMAEKIRSSAMFWTWERAADQFVSACHKVLESGEQTKHVDFIDIAERAHRKHIESVEIKYDF